MSIHTKVEEASSEQTSPEQLSVLAKDEEWTVCYCVANNPNTLIEDLLSLYKENKTGMAIVGGTIDLTDPSSPPVYYRQVHCSVRTAVLNNPTFEPKLREYASSLGVEEAENLPVDWLVELVVGE